MTGHRRAAVTRPAVPAGLTLVCRHRLILYRGTVGHWAPVETLPETLRAGDLVEVHETFRVRKVPT